MLVYCKQPLTEALGMIDCAPLIVTVDTDPNLLRSLDKILEIGLYSVVVAQE